MYFFNSRHTSSSCNSANWLQGVYLSINGLTTTHTGLLAVSSYLMFGATLLLMFKNVTFYS